VTIVIDEKIEVLDVQLRKLAGMKKRILSKLMNGEI
jgi:hypothetical protein